MAKAADRRAPYESGGAGEEFGKRPFRTDACPTMENLPDEILLNIFIRLLAQQLAQMRSVSKTWNALLSQPSFVKSHLHRSICNNNEQNLLVFPDQYNQFKQYSSQFLHLEPINFIINTPTNLPIRAIGSVNGLICLSGYSYSDIHIWNSSLSAVKTIPPPNSMLPISHSETSIRFGFDPKTDDYKLVKLSWAVSSVRKRLPVEVYNMRKGSWESITQSFPSHITRVFNNDYLCVDGHGGYLHWQTGISSNTEETILSFDLGSESFLEIPLPDSILDSNHRQHRLGVLGGKLCEMSWHVDGAWEVWVMEEYGVPETWVKRHVFSQFNDVYVLGFTLRNEYVFQDRHGRLVLYDPIANNTKMSRTKLSALRVLEYVDSLVWV